jgi:hypothetical protein
MRDSTQRSRAHRTKLLPSDLPGDLGSLLVLSLDGFVDLFAMHGNTGGCVDAQPYFVASNVNNGDLDVITDHDCLVTLPR